MFRCLGDNIQQHNTQQRITKYNITQQYKTPYNNTQQRVTTGNNEGQTVNQYDNSGNGNTETDRRVTERKMTTDETGTQRQTDEHGNVETDP